MGEDPNLDIFLQLKDILDKVFYQKEDTFLKNTIFGDHENYYKKLKKLHTQKMELQKLKALVTLPKPFVIEFSGTPRTGKTTTIHNLYDFFKKGGFDVSLIEEFTTSSYYKEELKEKVKDMGVGERNIFIAEEVYKQLEDSIHSFKDIILIDRSLNDRQIWNYRRLLSGDIKEEKYLYLRDRYQKASKEDIDFLVITYADPIVALKRDYVSSLALEKRSFLNYDNIHLFNQSLDSLKDLFEESVDSYMLVDTSDMSMNDVSLCVASEILPVMRKKYIKSFKDKYHLK